MEIVHMANTLRQQLIALDNSEHNKANLGKFRSDHLPQSIHL